MLYLIRYYRREIQGIGSNYVKLAVTKKHKKGYFCIIVHFFTKTKLKMFKFSCTISVGACKNIIEFLAEAIAREGVNKKFKNPDMFAQF